MLDISITTARVLNTGSWTVLLLAGLLSFAALAVLVWSNAILNRDYTERLQAATLTASIGRDRAAVLERQAADSRLRLATLLAPRKLDQSARLAVRKRLEGQARCGILIGVARGDDDTQRYAGQIAELLRNAGFTVLDSADPAVEEAANQPGVRFVFHDFPPTIHVAATLLHAFKSVGIDAGFDVRPDLVPGSDSFLITVGPRL